VQKIYKVRREYRCLKAIENLKGGKMNKKPVCKLVGENGNVFNIIGLVSRALKRAGQPEKAKEFAEKAMSSKSYDDVLMLLHFYVEVE